MGWKYGGKYTRIDPKSARWLNFWMLIGIALIISLCLIAESDADIEANPILGVISFLGIISFPVTPFLLLISLLDGGTCKYGLPKDLWKSSRKNLKRKSNEKSIVENTVKPFSEEDLTFKRTEGMSDKEYTRNIIKFEQELAEKKKIIIDQKKSNPTKKLTREEIGIIFHPLLISSQQKNKMQDWLLNKGDLKYLNFSGNPIDLSDELYSLWVKENSFHLIKRYFSETLSYSSTSPSFKKKKEPEIKKGKRGGRYTEDKTKDGRPYRRYF